MRCTARDLCAIAGLTRGGETYNRVKAALQRFTHTGYSAKNIFRHPVSKEPVLAEDWNIIADFRLLPDHQDSALEDGLPASYLAVSAAFLNRLKNGQLKPVNLGLWRELPLGLEKPIYHYLDKNFYGGKDRHEIGLNKFGNRIALMGTYKPSQLKRLYNKPLANLAKLGFLAGFRFEKSRSAEDPEKIVFFPGSRARIQRKAMPRLPMHQQTPDPRSDARISGNSATPESDVERLVAYFSLKQFAVEKTSVSARERLTARQILGDAGGDFAVARAIIDFAIQEAKKTGFNIRNIGGVLTNSYPERAIAARTAAHNNASAGVAQRTQADLKHRYETWHRQEVKKRYESLEPEERDRLLTQAQNDLRTDRHSATFLGLPEHYRLLMAESKVRRRLGRDLPSFDEWVPKSA
jgi:hypothetical protein